MGADDYVIKPFRTRELIERIKIQEKNLADIILFKENILATLE